ncbi:hypothetical protein LIA77_00137 [Sarocladium implicatum]|nr:hypothetical protein LIA77_00137 [Sarocladium implicatum]
MRFSTALISILATTTASALPILDTVNNLLGGNSALESTNDAVHLVWTNTKADHLVSLSVLDRAAENVLAHTCGDKLVEGVFSDLPINFSQVTPEGLGQFVVGDAKYVVKDVLSGGAGAVQCVHRNLEDVAVLDCVVPVASGLVLPIVSDVKDMVTCLTSGLPLLGDLPVLAGLPL